MRSLRVLVAAGLLVAVFGAPSGGASSCAPVLKNHTPEAHAVPKGHSKECGMRSQGSLEVSKTGGLGSIDAKGKVAAIVERDEGTVALVDLDKMKVIGRYEDEVQGSLDGDVSFSADGDWLFYARQTSDFDEDGIHVLNVTNRTAPSRTMYQPAGGAYRLEYYKNGAGEWLVVLDAIDGLVVYRFVRETGTIVQVFQDATPALKVGGPASAGVFIVKKDPKTGRPLMYVTTGMTGLQVYDFSDPMAPEIVGEWSDVGLADVKVHHEDGKRLVFAATEYWFDKTIPPAVFVLDATKLDDIKKVGERTLGVPAEDTWRVQGLVVRRHLFVAHSHAGLLEYNHRGRLVGVVSAPETTNEAAGYQLTPYAMDVVMHRGQLLVSDAGTGHLSKWSPQEPTVLP